MQIEVDIDSQILRVRDADDRIVSEYRVSTARNGAGELLDSEQTPRGWHVVRARIGAGQPLNTVFRGRRPTGEIYSATLREAQPDRDWILTRILWLSGLEPGKNRLGKVDTMRRYIYIHGCPDEDELGVPASHGCIKMRNQDVIELFDQVPTGTRVFIHE
ncbi:MAG: L,D-transpeptidase [Proteobacteria bacterium]|jgi:lipoprotein-anchoring transpeptidase ErfK/SrfK|nr:L,D-transpeptidase [Pseudomonadota bacterium]